MRKSRFTETEIVDAGQQAEAGVPIEDVTRKDRASVKTTYVWRVKERERSAGEVTRLEQPEEKYRQRKQLVADLSVETPMIRCVACRSCVPARSTGLR